MAFGGWKCATSRFSPSFPPTKELLECFKVIALMTIMVIGSVSGNLYNIKGGRNSMLRTRVISTRYGKLQGIILPMDQHKYLKPVEVYLGVPYATPPLGINRWEHVLNFISSALLNDTSALCDSFRFSPTRTPSPWEGVKTLDSPGPACPQKLPDISNETASLTRMPKGRLEYLRRLLPFLSNQSEDCLYMNIYTPVQGTSIINMKRLSQRASSEDKHV